MPTQHVHLGYRCIPSVLINDVLGITDKGPFADVRLNMTDAADIIGGQFRDYSGVVA